MYDNYCVKLDCLQFYRCRSITLNYEGELKDSSIQYHKDDNELFYVKDWMGRRVFKDFISDLVDYFEIDMDTNVLEGIFEADDKNQTEIIDQYVNYELSCDNDFMDTLKDLNADIAMGVQIVDRSDEEDMVDTSKEFGNRTREELNDEEDDRQIPEQDDSESQEEDDEKDVQEDENIEDEDEYTLPATDDEDESDEPDDEEDVEEDEIPDDEDEVEEQENYEPRQSHSSRIGDDNESGRSQGYGDSSSNNLLVANHQKKGITPILSNGTERHLQNVAMMMKRDPGKVQANAAIIWVTTQMKQATDNSMLVSKKQQHLKRKRLPKKKSLV